MDSFQDHVTWFLYGIPKLVLSRPFDLILSLCTQLTPFQLTLNIIFYFAYLPNCLLLRPCDLIFALYTQITLFKTILPNFIVV